MRIIFEWIIFLRGKVRHKIVCLKQSFHDYVLQAVLFRNKQRYETESLYLKLSIACLAYQYENVNNFAFPSALTDACGRAATRLMLVTENLTTDLLPAAN